MIQDIEAIKCEVSQMAGSFGYPSSEDTIVKTFASFVHGMEDLCGQVCQISRIIENAYGLNERSFKLDGFRFAFDRFMLTLPPYGHISTDAEKNVDELFEELLS